MIDGQRQQPAAPATRPGLRQLEQGYGVAAARKRKGQGRGYVRLKVSVKTKPDLVFKGPDPAQAPHLLRARIAPAWLLSEPAASLA